MAWVMVPMSAAFHLLTRDRERAFVIAA